MEPETTQLREDLERSTRSARSISGSLDRAEALLKVAQVALELDRALGLALLAEAELVARSIVEPADYRAAMLSLIAQTVAPLQPAEAERIAWTITDPDHLDFQAWALLAALRAVAPTDLAEAERIARSIPSSNHQAMALCEHAAATMRQDPASARDLLVEAEHLARAIDVPHHRQHALEKLALARNEATDAG